MAIKYKQDKIWETAEKITFNSETFGDEVLAVVGQLAELSDSANEFGVEVEGRVNDMWGGKVAVVAVPDVYRHSWSF